MLAEAVRRQRQAEARARLLEDLGTDDITERERVEVRREWRGGARAAPAKSRTTSRAKSSTESSTKSRAARTTRGGRGAAAR